MRPILLEMNGFASFREPARVDFTEADYFALVGPTGSGKSTVIDAMTFALYGSVPRWGRKGMVSLALAPTTARGTVKLVFEADGHRYVVARELRRVGGQVQQRNASLERVLDTGGTGELGEQTEVLAKDLSDVAGRVERLLGLSYEDFCQCVVLPQGQFAAFLHAKPSERQEILLRLLGAEHYRQMMMRANQRASDAEQRAITLTETLAGLGDATQDAEDAARVTEEALAAVSRRVSETMPKIQSTQSRLADAQDELTRLRDERDKLADLSIPGGISELDDKLSSARASVDKARDVEADAQTADETARRAVAEGPRRARLELIRQHHTERDQATTRVSDLEAETADAAQATVRADDAVTAAAHLLEQLREHRDQASRVAEAAAQRVRDLTAQHAALAAVEPPDGVGQLDLQARAATDSVERARCELTVAENVEREARVARDQVEPTSPLEQARRDLADLDGLAAALQNARTALTTAQSDREQAELKAEAAETTSQERQDDLDVARRAHIVADLRPHLVAGLPCPVCEQPVGTLPDVASAPAIADAQARYEQASKAAATAQKAVTAAARKEEKAQSVLESAMSRRSDLLAAVAETTSEARSRGALPTVADLLADVSTPDADLSTSLVAGALGEVDARLKVHHELEEASRRAYGTVKSARRRAGDAQAQVERLQANLAEARDQLRAARDQLVTLGVPPIDDSALTAGWASLVAWASERTSLCTADLAQARPAADSATAELDAAAARFAAADRELAELRTRATTAVKAEEATKTRLQKLLDRITELDQLLTDAPGLAQLAADLAQCDRLEADASTAGDHLTQARADRAATEQALTDLKAAEKGARSELSAARDRLVPLGAPALDDTSLLAAWTTLQKWARGEATAREKDLPGAQPRAAVAQADLDRLTAQVSADLSSASIDLPPEMVADGAAPAVAAALAQAHAATERIVERRAEAADLAAKRDQASAEQHVARMLGDLLRSDKFQRWLVAAAIDTLVAEASVNLTGLSGGQFDLTYDNGEFFVIDHTDADSHRSVRTLSGGETFQASLALALALSSQLTALAAAGAARLDSIFLDEGFGTLDPDTLDVVASTLETLAQGQRVVGVITHVAGLAERVPVRFVVSRDTRTSRVARQGLPAEEESA